MTGFLARGRGHSGTRLPRPDPNPNPNPNQEEGNRNANKKFPLAHRCLGAADWRWNNLLQSVLDSPREATLIAQDSKEGYGEGLDLGLGHMTVEALRDAAKADRIELVSGTDKEGTWKETSAGALPEPFKKFRKVGCLHKYKQW